MRHALTLCALGSALLVAGCGAPSPAVPAPAPSTKVAPHSAQPSELTPSEATSTTPGSAKSALPAVAPVGGSTPLEAVRGFFGALTGAQPAQACAYVLPTSKTSGAACASGLGASKVVGAPVTFGAVSTAGDRGLLTVVTHPKLCIDTSCLANTDPRTGQPANPAGFAGAYDAAVNGDNSPAVPLQRMNGRWYVVLG